MSAKPESIESARRILVNPERAVRSAKRDARRLRRRLEKALLDDTPARVTRGWVA